MHLTLIYIMITLAKTDDYYIYLKMKKKNSIKFNSNIVYVSSVHFCLGNVTMIGSHTKNFNMQNRLRPTFYLFSFIYSFIRTYTHTHVLIIVVLLPIIIFVCMYVRHTLYTCRALHYIRASSSFSYTF